MPPVGLDSSAMRPFVMAVSTSVMKASARACLRAAKSLRWARMLATVGRDSSVDPFLVGDWAFFFRGEAVGDGKESLSSSEMVIEFICFSSCLKRFCFRGESSGFEGENLSLWSLTISGSQKASMLGRRFGAVGIRACFFEGEASFEGLGS